MSVIEFKPRPKRAPSVLSRVDWIKDAAVIEKGLNWSPDKRELTTHYENAHGKRYHTLTDIKGKDLYDEATAL